MSLARLGESAFICAPCSRFPRLAMPGNMRNHSAPGHLPHLKKARRAVKKTKTKEPRRLNPLLAKGTPQPPQGGTPPQPHTRHTHKSLSRSLPNVQIPLNRASKPRRQTRTPKPCTDTQHPHKACQRALQRSLDPKTGHEREKTMIAAPGRGHLTNPVNNSGGTPKQKNPKTKKRRGGCHRLATEATNQQQPPHLSGEPNRTNHNPHQKGQGSIGSKSRHSLCGTTPALTRSCDQVSEPSATSCFPVTPPVLAL